MNNPMKPENCPPPMTPQLEARVTQLFTTCVDTLNEVKGLQGHFTAPEINRTDVVARMMYYALAPNPSLLKMAGCEQDWLGGTEHMLNILMELSRLGDGPLTDTAVALILGKALRQDEAEHAGWHLAVGFGAYDTDWCKGSAPFFEWLRDVEALDVIVTSEEHVRRVLAPLDMHMQAGALFYEVATIQVRSEISEEDHLQLEKGVDEYANGMIEFIES